jgi:hypothetical protein
VKVATGEQQRIPLRFELPKGLAAGSYEIHLTAKFDTGETQEDRFNIDVLSPPDSFAGPGPSALPRHREPAVNQPIDARTRIALFDPKGETTVLLNGIGAQSQPVSADADLSSYDVLIVGKAALTAAGPAPDIRRVRDGLKVIVFEQTSEILEKRFGFRVEEYGLRQLFPRVADHPVLAGIKPGNFRDWRGEATILPPRLKYELRPRYGPTVRWAGIPVTRVWRCGNRGNAASVLIEKPARGDFLPILDGGFSLQFSPLMEYREGGGMVLFCQIDVTARTETEPAAEVLVRNLLRYVSRWKPAARRSAVYAGDPAGKNFLEVAGVPVGSYEGGKLLPDQVLVVGAGGGRALANHANVIAGFLKSGGNLLAVGLDQADADALLPFKVTMKKAEHISAFFEPFEVDSLLAGAGPADVHNRDPREFSLVSSGARVAGDGVLAVAESANVIFCQIAPWQFAGGEQLNLRRTYRRASFLIARLLANLRVAGSTPLLERFSHPVDATKAEKRWLDGLYLDQPEEWDDPYRFFRW